MHWIRFRVTPGSRSLVHIGINGINPFATAPTHRPRGRRSRHGYDGAVEGGPQARDRAIPCDPRRTFCECARDLQQAHHADGCRKLTRTRVRGDSTATCRIPRRSGKGAFQPSGQELHRVKRRVRNVTCQTAKTGGCPACRSRCARLRESVMV